MVDIEVVEATKEHAEFIAQRLRDADVLELVTLGRDPYRAVIDGYNRSRKCWVAMVDGDPACIFGVAALSIVSSKGSPWMLGTDATEKIGRRLLTDCAGYIDIMIKAFRLLENHVDTRNDTSIRWLEKLGFTIHEGEPMGLSGEIYHRFTMEAA